MIDWSKRAEEERALLVPSFSATLLWQAATGHHSEVKRGVPLELSFLVLPIALHRGTRELLPKSVVTSLPVWLDENPLVRSGIAERARTLVPFTKDAMTFGGTRGMFLISPREIAAVTGWKRKVNSVVKGTSQEVADCVKRAEFVGRWFARIGNGATVMALLGVRP